MSTIQTRHEIVIVGAGMVGLTAAALLAKSGRSVAVVERGPIQAKMPDRDRPYAARVSAVNIASMRIFEHLDIADELIDDRACGYENMHIWDANSAAEIDFNALDTGLEYLGYIIENDFIINSLLRLLKVNNEVTFYPDSPLLSLRRHSDQLELGLPGAQLNTDLLIGADGQYSRVRSLAQIPVESGLFNQTALVCRINTEYAHQHTALQCFHHHGPIAYLPLADGSCSIVWSCDTDRAQQLRQMDDAQFALEIEHAMQSRLGKVEVCGPRAGFDLAQQHACRYVEPHIALIGDAAHRTHPLAGLGANLGLQDAAVLSEVILDATQQQRSISSRATLRKYERKRRPQNAMTLQAMQAFKSGFSSHGAAFSGLRVAALLGAQSFNPMKALISELATGTRGDLAEICKPK